MDRQIVNALSSLGCSSKEIQFYMASFNLGNATINEITKAAKLQRSTAYQIAASLLEKELVSEDFKEYGKSLVAAEPTVLVRKLKAKQRQIGRREMDLEDNMDKLLALYQAPEIRPRIKTFQGASGLVTVWNDILSSSGEILLWTNQASESNIFTPDKHEAFIQQRLARKLPMKVLAVDNLEGRQLARHDATNLRTTKLLHTDVSFSAETYIYDSKVAILDYNQDIIGIIIESNQVHEAQKAMFNASWSALSPTTG